MIRAVLSASGCSAGARSTLLQLALQVHTCLMLNDEHPLHSTSERNILNDTTFRQNKPGDLHPMHPCIWGTLHCLHSAPLIADTPHQRQQLLLPCHICHCRHIKSAAPHSCSDTSQLRPSRHSQQQSFQVHRADGALLPPPASLVLLCIM